MSIWKNKEINMILQRRNAANFDKEQRNLSFSNAADFST